MPDTDSSKPIPRHSEARFATTLWPLVLAAGSPESPQHSEAIESLCQTYWFPLYAFLRRHGHTSDQAEDYIQGFFAYLLDKRTIYRADPRCGKFRSFLLGALKHFLADERDRTRAQKRGGGRRLLSVNMQDAEDRYVIEPADQLSPDRLFERHWALTVLNRTMTRLKMEWTTRGKEDVFAVLSPYLVHEAGTARYQEAAGHLRMSEGAVKTAVHRLRQRYRKLLCEEIAQTVASESQIEEEIDDLFRAVAF